MRSLISNVAISVRKQFLNDNKFLNDINASFLSYLMMIDEIQTFARKYFIFHTRFAI